MATNDGKTIFAGLTTGIVLVWSITPMVGTSFSTTSLHNSLITKKALDAHTDVVTALAVCSAHNFIVSASRDNSAIVWHLTKFIFIRQLTGHPAAVTAVAVNESTVLNFIIFLILNIKYFLGRYCNCFKFFFMCMDSKW